MTKRIHFILFILFFAPVFSMFGQQSLTNLKKKRETLEKQINYTNLLISKISKNKKNTLYSLTLLNNKIKRRQELTSTLKQEINLLSDSTLTLNVQVKNLNSRLKILKKEYGEIAFYVYKNNNPYTRLVFLFSSQDINQAYQRLRYLSEISSYIRKEANRIMKIESLINNKKSRIKNQIIRKKRLLDQEISQISLLELEQKKKNLVKQKLQKKERSLQSKLRKQKRESDRLNKQIQKTIALAIAKAKREKARAKAREKERVKAKTGKKLPYTPKITRLSKAFTSNKGKLPWPVKKGIVSQTFGVHQHPVLKHVKIRNNGINITTNPGAMVYTVFSGKVVSVVPITTTNIAVIVQHGDYFTVYSHLRKSFVKPGQSVNTGMPIGIVYTTLQGDTMLHFELWKNKQTLNPMYWLISK